MNNYFTRGITVRARGERFTVLDVDPLPGSLEMPLVRLSLRGLEGELLGAEIVVLHPIEPVEPDPIPDISLDRPGRIARFRLLHDVFRLELSPPGDLLISASKARVRFEPYQYVPALRALELPRPRLLLADDVGLGKTIEAGLILQDLAARRRANRVLIVCPAGIMPQWQQALERKFGLKFLIFDRDTIQETRRRHEAGSNPWEVESHIIASVDFIKRREGAFRELSASQWDIVIVDEAHHLSTGHSEDDMTDRHRLGQWLAEATDALFLLTATPHDGYDRSFYSLLELLESSLIPPDGHIRYERYRRHMVRRLKGHIKNEDGANKFFKRTVTPLPVLLTGPEMDLHAAVLSQSRDLEDMAQKAGGQLDSEAIRLVATILRKRAASSRYALKRTLEQRLVNLTERVEELEIQRDHIRALRRGDTIADEALARLERDAHKSYLAVIRRLGRKVRRSEDEQKAIEDLLSLLKTCESEPESKMTCLFDQLQEIHREHPEDKIIIFTEYSDTAGAIVQAMENEAGYHNRICLLTGDFSPHERTSILTAFSGKGKLLLVATDAAGEGLNLHYHCHRIIHFELPWNPNRLEQRNGRIDRYGQTHVPIVNFLYAQQTYEGEVLTRLVDKIERQMTGLGSVGDVLGGIQSARIEEILARAPEDIPLAIRNADREIDEEIARVAGAPLSSVLGDGRLDQDEMKRAESAAHKGVAQGVHLIDFITRAVTAAGHGGRIEKTNGRLYISTPSLWTAAMVQDHYEIDNDVPDESIDERNFLNEDHPLFVAAVRWVKGSRFDRRDDHRLAYVCTEEVTQPDMIATFLIKLRNGRGRETERLEAVRVTSAIDVSKDHEGDLRLLMTEGTGNLSPDILTRLFAAWWQEGREEAMNEARCRARNWRQSLITERNLVVGKLLQELEEWNQVTRLAILGKYVRQATQMTLFGKPEAEIPPAIRRKVRQHDDRYRRRREDMELQKEIADASIEPIGLLLRVPMSLVCDQVQNQSEGRG